MVATTTPRQRPRSAAPSRYRAWGSRPSGRAESRTPSRATLAPIAAARLVTSSAWARVWVAMATSDRHADGAARPGERRGGSCRRPAVRRPLPPGRPTRPRTARPPRVGSPDAPRMRRRKPVPVEPGGRGERGECAMGAEEQMYARVWRMTAVTTRRPRRPRRAARRGGEALGVRRPRATSAGQRSGDATPAGRCAAGGGRPRAAAASPLAALLGLAEPRRREG